MTSADSIAFWNAEVHFWRISSDSTANNHFLKMKWDDHYHADTM
jgi:hypothetical protein